MQATQDQIITALGTTVNQKDVYKVLRRWTPLEEMKKSMIALVGLISIGSGIFQQSRAGTLNGVLISGSMYFDGGHTISGDQSVIVMSLGTDPESPCEFHFPGDDRSYWTLSKYITAPTPTPVPTPSTNSAPAPAAAAPTPQPVQEQYNDHAVVAQPTPPLKRRHAIKEGEPDEDGKIWHRDAEGHLKWLPANKARRDEKVPLGESSGASVPTNDGN
jgi:hypothetical protein